MLLLQLFGLTLLLSLAFIDGLDGYHLQSDKLKPAFKRAQTSESKQSILSKPILLNQAVSCNKLFV